MADIAQTANNVTATSNTVVQLKQYGEAVVAGNFLYLKPSDNKYWKSDANASAEAANATAMALQEGGANEYGPVALGGDVDPGATLALGDRVWISANPGNITKTDADIVTGWYPTFAGFGITGGFLRLIFKPSGMLVP